MKLRNIIIVFVLVIFMCVCVFVRFGKLEPVPNDDWVITIDPNDFTTIKIEQSDSNKVEQKRVWGWGKIPKQNFCPHCGEYSNTKFCTDCKKERGNIPFIGVYCPKCEPDGKYAGKTEDVTEICGDCGAGKTWKYVYEDWQTESTKKATLRLEESNEKDCLNANGMCKVIHCHWNEYGIIEIDEYPYDSEKPNKLKEIK